MPAPASLHSVPSVKFIRSSASTRTRGGPSTHSSSPSAEHTTTRCRRVRATSESRLRNVGIIRASGCSARSSRSSRSEWTRGATWPSGRTPAPAERRHDSAMTARTVSGGAGSPPPT